MKRRNEMEEAIIRHIDEIGRIVLPQSLRTLYGIRPGASVEIIKTEDGILLKPIKAENA